MHHACSRRRPGVPGPALVILSTLFVSGITNDAQAAANEFSAATFVGAATCAGKFPRNASHEAGFVHLSPNKKLHNTCWTCPLDHKRTLDPNIEGPNACVQNRSAYANATKHEKGTGVLKTDCPDGQFLHIPNGFCYSCPDEYHRTTEPMNEAKDCARKLPADKHKAKFRGEAGCPDGAFKNGILDQCYTCPKGFERNPGVVSSDLSKASKACVRKPDG